MATAFKLPEVGEGIDAGTVVAILVSVGDQVEIDQAVLELETDKAVVEVPSSLAGVVASIDVEEGQEVEIGATVLTVDEAGSADDAADAADGADGDAADAADADDADATKASEDADEGGDASGDAVEAAGSSAAATKDESATSPVRDGTDGTKGGSQQKDTRPAAPSDLPAGLIPAAPSVRRLARELGVDLRAVQGSGILGRISAEDVRAYADGETPRAATGASPAQPPAQELPDFSAWGETERVKMSGIRKATVRTMANAWSTVPMVTHFDKADATAFEELRQRHKPDAERIGAKLTPTAMLIKVVAAALRKFPDFNASIDTATNEIVYKKYVNVGVAVDTENGLLVPVVKHADRKNILELASELGELAEKARDRKLSPAEMQGGNFSVSNLGGIGGTGFTPIVAPPDVAILGVSRGSKEPVWDEEQGAFVPRMMMPLSVTYDHRLIDGASAARFLRWICEVIEDPFRMTLEG